MKKLTQQFNVMYLDWNTNEPVWFNVLPVIQNEFKKAKTMPKSETTYEPFWKPRTKKELREFIDAQMKYHYWSKAEWECEIKPLFKGESLKMDLYEMFIKNNLGLLTEIMAENLGIEKKTKF